MRCLHRTYYLPSMTGIATAICEDIDAVRNPDAKPSGWDRKQPGAGS